MRGVALAALGLAACSNDQPPPITDSDGGITYADAAFTPTVIDAGPDAGAAYTLDFEGSCQSGYVPVWHFFDFQTHTPMSSVLQLSARSAPMPASLSAAPSVSLANVTGPDITTWTGVDVDPKLLSIGQMSRLYLRITVVEVPGTDGTLPVLVHYRQAFDCVVGP